MTDCIYFIVMQDMGIIDALTPAGGRQDDKIVTEFGKKCYTHHSSRWF